MAIRILKLNLAVPLVYAPIPAEEDAFDTASGSTDTIEVFRMEGALSTGPDGPKADLPGSAIAFRGRSSPPGGGGESFSLGPGEDGRPRASAIAQFPGDADPREALEEFAREAWWTGILLEGPLVLRRLEEDGKRVMQWISPARFPERGEGSGSIP